MYGHPLHVIYEKAPLELNPGTTKRRITAYKVLISMFLVTSLIFLVKDRVNCQDLSVYFGKPSNDIVYTVETSEIPTLTKRDDNTEKTTTTSKKDATTSDKKEDSTTDTPSKTTKEERTTEKTTDAKTTDAKNTDKTTDKTTDKESKTTDKPKDSKNTDKSEENKDEEKDDKTTSKATTTSKSPSKTTEKTTPTPTETESSTPVPIYDQPGIRFVFALFGFILLNMFAIVIHHIYLISSKAGNNYKTVDDDISPF